MVIRQIVGLLAALDECLAFADSVGNDFLQRTLQRLYHRCIGILEKSAVRTLIGGTDRSHATSRRTRSKR
jgi:hypothetical protein